jgi:hypothetical protein
VSLISPGVTTPAWQRTAKRAVFQATSVPFVKILSRLITEGVRSSVLLASLTLRATATSAVLNARLALAGHQSAKTATQRRNLYMVKLFCQNRDRDVLISASLASIPKARCAWPVMKAVTLAQTVQRIVPVASSALIRT